MKYALLLAVAAALVACGTAGTAPTPLCKGSQLVAAFTVVPGSAGAGNIVYRLRVTNTAAGPCFVSGLPAGKLLGANGKALPTQVRMAQRGIGTAARIILMHGNAARADARFSPDIPGPGEPASGKACEPKAFVFRVSAPGGGTVAAPLQPSTPVCEHGTLSFSLYTVVS
ncbi:MAG: DUF4232 domain-containing protein [Gaiellaceae bacterium]